MKNIDLKLKTVFLPFFIVTICFTALYTFLNWLLLIKLQLFSLKENLVNLIIPAVLCAILLLIWIRPRLKTLKLNNKKGKSWMDFYFFMMFLSAAAPVILIQFYMETATGKLLQLDNADQIAQQPASRYYTLKNFYIDKEHIAGASTFETSGKHDEYLNIDLYVTMPVYKSIADTVHEPAVWMGTKYHKQISNRLNDQEKDAQYKAFSDQCNNEFTQTDFNKFVYLKRVGNTDEHDGYVKALKSINIKNVTAPVLEAENQPFEARMGDTLLWCYWSAIPLAFILLMTIIPPIDEDAVKMLGKKKAKNPDDFDYINVFIPSKELFITPILIDINLLIYIIMVFSGMNLISFQSEDLLKWGANYGPYTTNGQWWRLLTSTFIHGGLMHIVSNMGSLLFAGIFLEKALGRVKFSLFYLITGLIASIVSLWWHPAQVSIGASGAIMGLYGVLIALLLGKVFPSDVNKGFLVFAAIFVGYNLFAGLVGTTTDNAAHVGGLVSGFLIGLACIPSLKKQTRTEPVHVPFLEDEHKTENFN